MDPLCPSNDGIEDTEHFLLLCPSFAVPRTGLLTGALALSRPYGFVNNSKEALMQVLLYGDKNLPNDLNKSILLLTLNFIHQTGRLDYNVSNSILSFSTIIASIANLRCCSHMYCLIYSFFHLVLTSVVFTFMFWLQGRLNAFAPCGIVLVV